MTGDRGHGETGKSGAPPQPSAPGGDANRQPALAVQETERAALLQRKKDGWQRALRFHARERSRREGRPLLEVARKASYLGGQPDLGHRDV